MRYTHILCLNSCNNNNKKNNNSIRYKLLGKETDRMFENNFIPLKGAYKVRDVNTGKFRDLLTLIEGIAKIRQISCLRCFIFLRHLPCIEAYFASLLIYARLNRDINHSGLQIYNFFFSTEI